MRNEMVEETFIERHVTSLFIVLVCVLVCVSACYGVVPSLRHLLDVSSMTAPIAL